MNERATKIERRSMNIFVLGSDKNPSGPDQADDFRQQLKQWEKDGTPIVVNFPVAVIYFDDFLPSLGRPKNREEKLDNPDSLSPEKTEELPDPENVERFRHWENVERFRHPHCDDPEDGD